MRSYWDSRNSRSYSSARRSPPTFFPCSAPRPALHKRENRWLEREGEGAAAHGSPLQARWPKTAAAAAAAAAAKEEEEQQQPKEREKEHRRRRPPLHLRHRPRRPHRLWPLLRLLPPPGEPLLQPRRTRRDPPSAPASPGCDPPTSSPPLVQPPHLDDADHQVRGGGRRRRRQDVPPHLLHHQQVPLRVRPHGESRPLILSES